MDFTTTNVPKVGRNEFVSALQPGDAVYCWGTEAISKIIEGLAGGPSHVLTVWRPSWASAPWLTVEATFPSLSHNSKSGVHVGMLADYLNAYPGNLVLTRRAVSPTQVQVELNAALSLLDDNYNWTTEVSIAARKLIPWLPALESKTTLYCSGLRQVMCEETVPYKTYGPDPNTPEQCFQDVSTEAICVLMQHS